MRRKIRFHSVESKNADGSIVIQLNEEELSDDATGFDVFEVDIIDGKEVLLDTDPEKIALWKELTGKS
jgi:hypothetical protein